jgi:predicted nucleic-acid-binding Zn-ribbon protein
MNKPIKIKAEYEIPVLRFASMTCPYCGHTINLMTDSIVNGGSHVRDSVDLHYMRVTCKSCGEHIDTEGEELDIEES